MRREGNALGRSVGVVAVMLYHVQQACQKYHFPLRLSTSRMHQLLQCILQHHQLANWTVGEHSATACTLPCNPHHHDAMMPRATVIQESRRLFYLKRTPTRMDTAVRHVLTL